MFGKMSWVGHKVIISNGSGSNDIHGVELMAKVANRIPTALLFSWLG